MDSWEKLEEDAEKLRCDIAWNLGDYSESDFANETDSVQSRVLDLVRRAKRLAEGKRVADGYSAFPLSELEPVDGARCPRCGRGFIVSEIEVDDTYVYDWECQADAVADYCPFCGAKLEG